MRKFAFLQDIGFYTLSEDRAKHTSITAPIARLEILITDRCNFNCTYCRGLRYPGDLSFDQVRALIDLIPEQRLKNIRFSGGEPTLNKDLAKMCKYAAYIGAERIAVSTNGSADFSCYEDLVHNCVDDFSISLDACCSSGHDEMTGTKGTFDKVCSNISKLAKLVYVTVGIVWTPQNIASIEETINFVSALGVADIRIIPSAQYNQVPSTLNVTVVNRHPILQYRINNFKAGRPMRGICNLDTKRCPLVIDDLAIAGRDHFPCIIYLREGEKPIGKMEKGFREARYAWYQQHNTHKDCICKENCLDVCVDYNNKAEQYKHARKNRIPLIKKE